MKLVEILARELKEWPEGARFVLFDGVKGAYADMGIGYRNLDIDASECDDIPHNSEVTRAQWQEAREALSKPIESLALHNQIAGRAYRWHLAPEGTTHAISENGKTTWYMREPANWYRYDEDRKHWDVLVHMPEERIRQLSVRPDEPMASLTSGEKPPCGAPANATHYIMGAYVVDSWWMREPGDNWYVWAETAKHWALDKPSAAQKNLMKRLPIKQDEKPWSGEGLPPAGTVCELRNVAACTDWAQATVVFASRNVVVWDWAGEPAINGLCTAYAHAVEMRPIRTPEQIAAEERENQISDICIIFDRDPNSPTNRNHAARLYDAGYRKVKDGKNGGDA